MNKLFILDLDDTLVQTSKDLHGNPLRLPHLTLVEGAREFLDAHGSKSILLSAGFPELQHAKLHTVGVHGSFKEVHIVLLPQDKAAVLKHVVQAAGVEPQDIVVVGDRIDMEIRAGNEFGCTTVRVRLPGAKYAELEPAEDLEIPAHTVENFAELMRLPLFA